MRANQSERLAAETEEQRKARLQRVRANQSERLKNRDRGQASEGACQSESGETGC